MNFWIYPVVGSVIGALAVLCGVWLSYKLKQPRPDLDILDVFIDPAQSDDDRAIAREILKGKAREYIITPHDIYERNTSSRFTSNPNRYYQHPAQYTDWLYKASRDVNRIKLFHEGMPQVVREMRGALNTNVLDEFLLKWAEWSDVFSGQLITAAIDGRINLDSPTIEELLSSEELPVPRWQVIVDSDGDYVLILPQSRLGLLWTGDKIYESVLRPFFGKVAAILASENMEQIQNLQLFFESVNWNDPELEAILRDVDVELQKWSRIVVRGVVSNRGELPTSISGSSVLRIKSKGFSYQLGEGDKSHVIENEISVPMIAVDDGLLGELPSLHVHGGGVSPFVFISKQYIGLDNSMSDLLALYGSDRRCRINVKRLDNKQILSSEWVPFRR